ncbi:uncharacterized protein [Diabrotica undecimpunctata]|uniref:uncharacterized protein n=1 Tax=Diabrotica undecimpunctata TaxID=50387 RepID=UPI003B641248
MSEQDSIEQNQPVVKIKSNVIGNEIQPLSMQGNLAHNWGEWSINFKIFLRATGLEEENDARKVALLLHYIGTDARNIYKSFEVKMDTVTFQEVVGKFEKYCNPKKNLTVERHYFLTRVQKDGETIEDFMTSLKNLSLTCELGILKESLVCDIFIFVLNPKYHPIKQKLLQEVDLKIEKVLQTASKYNYNSNASTTVK